MTPETFTDAAVSEPAVQGACRREEIEAKFLALASPVLGRERAVRLRDVIRSLE